LAIAWAARPFADPEGGRAVARATAPDLVADVLDKRTGAPLPAPISSRRRCGRGEAWSRTTRRSSSTWPRAACRSSDPTPNGITRGSTIASLEPAGDPDDESCATPSAARRVAQFLWAGGV